MGCEPPRIAPGRQGRPEVPCVDKHDPVGADVRLMEHSGALLPLDPGDREDPKTKHKKQFSHDGSLSLNEPLHSGRPEGYRWRCG